MANLFTLKKRTLTSPDGSELFDTAKHKSGRLLGNAGDQIELKQAQALGLVDADDEDPETPEQRKARIKAEKQAAADKAKAESENK